MEELKAREEAANAEFAKRLADLESSAAQRAEVLRKEAEESRYCSPPPP